MRSKINWLTHLIELVIVITGVSVAFWLSNIASNNKEHQLEKTFVANLKSDIMKDSAALAYCIKYNEHKVAVLEKGMELMRSDTEQQYSDSLMQYVGYIGNYNFFITESFTLTSLLQSGDIKLIRSVALKKELLRLLRMYDQATWAQDNWLEALDDSYFPLLNENVDMVESRPINKSFLYETRIKNYWHFTISDTNNLNAHYQLLLEQIDKVLAIMNRES